MNKLHSATRMREANDNSRGDIQACPTPARPGCGATLRASMPRVAYGAGHAPNEAASSMPRTIPAAARRRSRRLAWCARSAGGQRPARQTHWLRRARSTTRRRPAQDAASPSVAGLPPDPDAAAHERWARRGPGRGGRPPAAPQPPRRRDGPCVPRCGPAAPLRSGETRSGRPSRERRPRKGHRLSPECPPNCSDARAGSRPAALPRSRCPACHPASERGDRVLSGRSYSDAARMTTAGLPYWVTTTGSTRAASL